MKYYSELTKDLYDSKEDLIAAEAELTKAKADRAERAKEVTDAIKLANEKTKEANELLREFVKDYGSFKTTIKDDDVDTSYFPFSFMDMFNKFVF